MNALLIVLRGETKNKRFLIQDDQIMVMGRSVEHILMLDDPQVSRNHLLFEFRKGILHITDMGSFNGTTHQSRRLEPHVPIPVAHNDEIELGCHLLRVVITEKVAAEESFELDGTQRLGLLPSSEFTMGEKLGKGASGTVYLAEQKVLKRLVAVKLLHQNLTTDPEESARFISEAQLCAQIDSPHVVKIFDARIIHGRVYLIMEYVNGFTGLDLLKADHVNVAQILNLGEHIAMALQALLEVGVVHRDIKPGNILLDNVDTAKLADFGIAKPMMRENSQMLTPDGEGIGTLWYVSPEQACDGQSADECSDIYSLGATLYHLLAKKPPIRITSAKSLLRLLHDEPIPLIELMPECPPLLSDLIRRMLAKSPEERPSGPAEIIATLQEVRSNPQLANLDADQPLSGKKRATKRSRRLEDQTM